MITLLDSFQGIRSASCWHGPAFARVTYSGLYPHNRRGYDLSFRLLRRVT